MMKSADSPTHFPVPVTILTGFLGAGKTTLLNNILNSDHNMRIAVLVNDFGAVNVDAQLIVSVEGEMVQLSNGCICCTIHGDLLRETLQLLLRDEPPEYILIEASGVSDPASVALTFLIPEVMPMIKLDGVITVVDAEQFPMLEGENEWLGLAQIGFADIVVLNKVDLVTDTYREMVKTRIREIIPFARIIEAVQGQVEPELLLPSVHFVPEKLAEREACDIHVHAVDEVHEHDHDHILVYSTWSWTSSAPLERNSLQNTLISLPTTVCRAKGIIHLSEQPDYRFVFQLVGKRVDLVRHRPWQENERRQTQIVIISSYNGIDGEELTCKFENCIAKRNSNTNTTLN
ncbi:MAG: GTP-binding protein [Chloroflexota bacterium]